MYSYLEEKERMMYQNREKEKRIPGKKVTSVGKQTASYKNDGQRRIVSATSQYGR